MNRRHPPCVLAVRDHQRDSPMSPRECGPAVFVPAHRRCPAPSTPTSKRRQTRLHAVAPPQLEPLAVRLETSNTTGLGAVLPHRPRGRPRHGARTLLRVRSPLLRPLPRICRVDPGVDGVGHLPSKSAMNSFASCRRMVVRCCRMLGAGAGHNVRGHGRGGESPLVANTSVRRVQDPAAGMASVLASDGRARSSSIRRKRARGARHCPVAGRRPNCPSGGLYGWTRSYPISHQVRCRDPEPPVLGERAGRWRRPEAPEPGGPPERRRSLCGLQRFPEHPAYGCAKFRPWLSPSSGWRVVRPFSCGAMRHPRFRPDGSYHVGRDDGRLPPAGPVRRGGSEHDWLIGHDWGAIRPARRPWRRCRQPIRHGGAPVRLPRRPPAFPAHWSGGGRGRLCPSGTASACLRKLYIMFSVNYLGCQSVSASGVLPLLWGGAGRRVITPAEDLRPRRPAIGPGELAGVRSGRTGPRPQPRTAGAVPELNRLWTEAPILPEPVTCMVAMTGCASKTTGFSAHWTEKVLPRRQRGSHRGTCRAFPAKLEHRTKVFRGLVAGRSSGSPAMPVARMFRCPNDGRDAPVPIGCPPAKTPTTSFLLYAIRWRNPRIWRARIRAEVWSPSLEPCPDPGDADRTYSRRPDIPRSGAACTSAELGGAPTISADTSWARLPGRPWSSWPRPVDIRRMPWRRFT